MLIAGTGVDVVFGDSGEDTVYAGHGNDRVSGGANDDSLLGQVGNDRLAGDSGADRIWGGAGADHLDGGTGNDQLTASAGSTVVGGDQDDRISLFDDGGPVPPLAVGAAPRVRAGSGNDAVDTRDGRRSSIDCGPGRDRLYADPGDRAVGCETRSAAPRR